jgi:steroid 5-alpha reductase family enzyme
MNNKLAHLAVIFIGYIACIYSMNLTWNLFPESSLILKVLICHVEATIFIYLLSTCFNNSSWYDAFWSVIPVVLTVLCWTDISAVGNSQRALLMHACLLFWAIRLTYNWMRSWDGFSHEDWRYIMMKGKTNNKFQYFIVDFGSIHLIPTLCVYMALLPMIYALAYPGSELNSLDFLAAVIAVLAVVIQIISDQQMYNFRKNLREPQTMKSGLWYYSRHPNYFGEILFWFSLFIFALASNLSFLWLLIGTLIMYFLIAIASVSMMDKRSLERRPDFKEYMDSTPAIFINVFKKG